MSPALAVVSRYVGAAGPEKSLRSPRSAPRKQEAQSRSGRLARGLLPRCGGRARQPSSPVARWRRVRRQERASEAKGPEPGVRGGRPSSPPLRAWSSCPSRRQDGRQVWAAQTLGPPAAPCLGPPGGGLAPGRSPFGFASRLCTLSMWHLSPIPANNQLNLRSTTRLATGGPSTPLTPFRSLGLRAGEGFRTQFLSAQAESLGQPYCGPRDGPVHTPPWKWATTRLSSGRSSLAFGIVLVLAGARLTGSLVATDLSLGSLVLPLTYEPVNAVCPVL